jgi:hypothetical protein
MVGLVGGVPLCRGRKHRKHLKRNLRTKQRRRARCVVALRYGLKPPHILFEASPRKHKPSHHKASRLPISRSKFPTLRRRCQRNETVSPSKRFCLSPKTAHPTRGSNRPTPIRKKKDAKRGGYRDPSRDSAKGTGCRLDREGFGQKTIIASTTSSADQRGCASSTKRPKASAPPATEEDNALLALSLLAP